MDDVRYCELKFLQMLASDSTDLKRFYDPGGERSRAVGLSPNMYVDLAVTLVEDLYARFHEQHMQLLVARLRGELSPGHGAPSPFQPYQWSDPRTTLHDELAGQTGRVYTLELTYRGLRRIEELREILKRDRILEPFGVLLDARYMHKDLEDALMRSADISISVLYADMDNFKPINDQFGHAAGDVVMKAYFDVVRNSIGLSGTAYRVGGDEVVAVLIGADDARAVEIAEGIRKKVQVLKCEHSGKSLPGVTTSIGVATTPPDGRSADIESVAESRNRQAKAQGKNRVIAAPSVGSRNAGKSADGQPSSGDILNAQNCVQ